jgi:hypothetical protein
MSFPFTALWRGGWPLTRAASPSRPPVRYLMSNRLIVWRLGLPPLELPAGTCRPLKQRFEATFDKVWNGYLFSENRRKLNIKKFWKVWSLNELVSTRGRIVLHVHVRLPAPAAQFRLPIDRDACESGHRTCMTRPGNSMHTRFHA